MNSSGLRRTSKEGGSKKCQFKDHEELSSWINQRAFSLAKARIKVSEVNVKEWGKRKIMKNFQTLGSHFEWFLMGFDQRGVLRKFNQQQLKAQFLFQSIMDVHIFLFSYSIYISKKQYQTIDSIFLLFPYLKLCLFSRLYFCQGQKMSCFSFIFHYASTDKFLKKLLIKRIFLI